MAGQLWWPARGAANKPQQIMSSVGSQGSSHLHKRVGKYFLGRPIGEVGWRGLRCGHWQLAFRRRLPSPAEPPPLAGRALCGARIFFFNSWMCDTTPHPLPAPCAGAPAPCSTQGTYAKVKYGQHADSGEAVAIKVLDKERLVQSGMVEQIKREITILKQVRAGVRV